jgi:hypothetical protein
MSAVIEQGAWKQYTTPAGVVVKHKKLTEFVESEPPLGIGLSMETTRRLLEESAAEVAAETVREALWGDQTPIREHGANRHTTVVPARHHGSSRHSDTTSRTEQRDSAYLVSRLKRDDPKLAAEVVEGKITPNAAAVKAGIRHKYARIRTDDPQRAVAKLLEHYDRDAILKAIGGAA